MRENTIDNNQVSVLGRMNSGFTFSHTVFGEEFYKTEVLVSRLSESKDRIPVVISERLVDITDDFTGRCVQIQGQFRSYNQHEKDHSRLMLSVFARDIRFGEETSYMTNQIILDGFICKPPAYRMTPYGREITDILVAVNRPYGKSDYIPCILWGRNARYGSSLPVGAHIRLRGRIQSREYRKKTEGGYPEIRTAYEVSVNRMEDISVHTAYNRPVQRYLLF